MTDDDNKHLPARRKATSITKKGKRGSFLEKVRAAKAIPPSGELRTRTDPSLIEAAVQPSASRPRLVFAIDATASRERAWETAKATTDALFQAVPGELDVALAVHGGSRIKLFTPFAETASPLRDQAQALRCEAGVTRLVEILERCSKLPQVKVLVYVGDVFEEDLSAAEAAAALLRLRGTRVIVLHDQSEATSHADASRHAFERIATITHGALLPFDASSVSTLRALLEAVATLAVGGIKLLRARERMLTAGPLLLQLLGGDDD